jgi:hypothetical protein
MLLHNDCIYIHDQIFRVGTNLRTNCSNDACPTVHDRTVIPRPQNRHHTLRPCLAFCLALKRRVGPFSASTFSLQHSIAHATDIGFSHACIRQQHTTICCRFRCFSSFRPCPLTASWNLFSYRFVSRLRFPSSVQSKPCQSSNRLPF